MRSGSPLRWSCLTQLGRGRRHHGALYAVLAPLLLAGTVWVLFFSSVLGARSVSVTGTVALTADEVRAAAAIPLGRPLLLLDTGAVESRVRALSRVARVEVSRSVTATVHVRVTERVAVLAAPTPDGVHLVDATATDFATVPEAPPGVPELRVPRVTGTAASAAVQVVTGLPARLRGQIAAVRAESAADVRLRLVDGREVHWGAADQGERKAAVLELLLSQPGDVYDVTTPDLPTIS